MGDIRKLRDFLDLISRKWVVDILWSLREEQLRFSDLAEEMDGISNKVLSNRLSDLIEEELVLKTVFSLVPLNIKYRLSQRGISMVKLLSQLQDQSEYL